MGSYCDIAPGHPYHGPYHEKEYGFPIRDDSRLFERLVLEINQAGLSWLTILMKRAAFRDAFDQFDVERVAAYGRRDRSRLMSNAGIIRNELKINATIENAQFTLGLRRKSRLG
jgi:DNA-3-methyladenine glycosylase I